MPTPFQTDEQIAGRIRAVATVLRRRHPEGGVESGLALELDDVALILDPDRLSERDAAGNAGIVQPRLPFG